MSDYQVPVLLYHRIVNAQSKIGKHKIYVREKNFREQMKYLKEHGYKTITFQDLAKNDPPIPSFTHSLILTFDDGYEDNYTILFPILKEFGFKAVIYLVTGQTRNEWALKEGEPELKMMTREMIKEMSACGIEFGGHTRSHADLKRIMGEKLEAEISGNKKDVEEITGQPALSFAYPYGAYNAQAVMAVRKAGYQFGITTVFGPDKMEDDLMRIKRIEIRPKDNHSKFRFKTSGYYFQRSYLSHLLS